MYIPFEQVTVKLFHELVARGYKHYVLQRFSWPSVPKGTGFLLSAYENLEDADRHAAQLDLEETAAKQNIATTRSFDNNLSAYEPIRERVVTFAASCSEKLRKQHSRCSSLTVFLQTNRHRQDQQQYNPSITVDLPFASNSAIDLGRYATIALKRIYREGFGYKKAGVIVQDLSPEASEQATLFNHRDTRHDALMQAFDKINRQYGQNSVRLGAQGQRMWRMKQERLSPRYSTDIKDIIVVRL